MDTDICIVGGGLVGLAAALAFSHQGRRVTLLETADLQPEIPPRLDARSLALSHATVQILRSLELWPSLQSSVAAIRDIHVSSAGHFGVTRLRAEEMPVEAMGYVIEYHVLFEHLLQQAKKEAHIEIISPAIFQSLQQDGSGVTVQFQLDGSHQSLRAALLVVADGAHSSARECLGVAARVMDFDQVALIANVEVDSDGLATAYERFTPRGPLALLPLTDRRYALVWTNTPQRGQQLMALSDDEFLQALYADFGYRLGHFSGVGARAQFPLKLTRAQQLAVGRSVLIGNAANTLHPVAGQGLNLAMRDIAVLHSQLSSAGSELRDLPERLAEYAQLRQADQKRTVSLSTSLVQLFSNDLPVLNHARSAALAALDLCPVLKKEFGWQGMGFGSGYASLMRGAS